jgi:hypothetical protein
VSRIGPLIAAIALVPPGPDDPGRPTLPESWLGTYAGTFTIEGDSAIEPFRGELRVAPIGEGPAVSWTIIYGEGDRRQVRPYELVPVDGQPGRFEIDEKNGVRIAMRLVGEDLLLGQFTVGDSLIVARYERSADAIRAELATFDAASPRSMRVEGAGLEVSSIPLRSVQRATLRRVSADAEGPG